MIYKIHVWIFLVRATDEADLLNERAVKFNKLKLSNILQKRSLWLNVVSNFT